MDWDNFLDSLENEDLYVAIVNTGHIVENVRISESEDEKFSVRAFAYLNYCGGVNYAAMEFYPTRMSLAQKTFKIILRCALENNANLATYITKKDDQKEIQEVLKSIGFQVVDTFRNSNTGNECLLWTANLANLNLD